MRYDYLIVGQGLAGSVLAYTMENKGLSFFIVDADHPETSSKVAAGLISPITGIRIVKTWKADEIFPFAFSFYKKLEDRLGEQVLFEKNIYKPYQTIEEENDIISKSADVGFSAYLNYEVDTSPYQQIVKNQRGAIEIRFGGNVWVEKLIQLSHDYFHSKEMIKTEEFDFEKLDLVSSGVRYGEIEAKKIIFCEGYRAINNPYFSWLPFSVTKGELLRVKMPNMPDDKIFSKGGFVLPIGDDEFIMGSSYDHTLENKVTQKGRDYILRKMGDVLAIDAEIVGQRSAIRPTVRDRRPFIGIHPEKQQIAIFNGLGTKGVTLSPYFACQFVESLESNTSLDDEVNIKRHFSLYSALKK